MQPAEPQGHQPIPTARSRPASFQSRVSMGASPDDVCSCPLHEPSPMRGPLQILQISGSTGPVLWTAAER